MNERKETLQLLKSLGVDTKVVEDEIKEIKEYLNESHSIHSDDSMEELPVIKVVFFVKQQLFHTLIIHFILG